jgi:hypothetical protein
VNSHPEPFFAFEWPVAPDYTWVEWLNGSKRPARPSSFNLEHPQTLSVFEEAEGQETGPILMAVEGPSTMFRPMDREHATLFRVFANLDAMNREAILAFARRYGWLGVTPRPHQVLTLSGGGLHYAEGEPHLLWVVEVARMREAILGWEHWRSSKRDAEKLNWLFNVNMQHVQGRMQFTANTSPQMQIAPMNLLSAMWLQLALAISGNKEFAKCKFCERQFEISTDPSGFRSNRAFCGRPSCKTNDYRRRQRAARELAAQKVPITEIAAKTKTPVATVKRWVAATKKSPRSLKRAK